MSTFNAIKRIKVPTLVGSRVSVWFDPDWNEYQVRLSGNRDATYHTSDKLDALATAQHMRNTCAASGNDFLPGLTRPAKKLGGSKRAGSGRQSRQCHLFSFITQFSHPGGFWICAVTGNMRLLPTYLAGSAS